MAGVKGRSGRPKKILKLRLAGLLDETWPIAERRAVIRQLNRAAKEGDVEAAKTLLAYAYGRPAQRHEISGPDGAALDVDIHHVTEQLRAKLENLARAQARPATAPAQEEPPVAQRPRLIGGA